MQFAGLARVIKFYNYKHTGAINNEYEIAAI